VHRAGGLVYGDGANLNAILGVVKPAEMGFDCLHINVHKTFRRRTRRRPGRRPGRRRRAARAVPARSPVVVKGDDGSYSLDYNVKSIGA